MTIWEYLKFQKDGYLSMDTYDTVFDTIITVEADTAMEDSSEPYERFVVALLKHITMEDSDTAHWADFVEDNLDTFRTFAEEHWVGVPDDKDDLIYEWVRELHYYLAGYVGDSTYDAFIKEVLE